MAKPSCEYCKHGVVEGGDPDVGLFGTFIDCMAGKVSPDVLDVVREDDYESFAARCGAYEPKMITQCTVCKKEMNTPAHEAFWFYPAYAPVADACCSEACKKRALDQLAAILDGLW